MKLNEAVYAVLRDNLDAGLFEPGLSLREVEIATLLEISRVPVRAALLKLTEEGRLLHLRQRGFFVPGEQTGAPVSQLNLSVRPELRDVFQQRNWRDRLFNSVEMDIAASLAFGTFRINETHMAQSLGVSRTVVREFLSSLLRIGMVHQLSNGRWQVDRLTEKDISDHYALRCILEPVALQEVFPRLPKKKIETALWNLDQALSRIDTVDLEILLQLERELHTDVVLATTNRHMIDVIRRSQLPMISTNISFATTGSVQYALETICEHRAVFQALADGDPRAAGDKLIQHLERAEATSIRRLSELDLSMLVDRPSYLEPVGP